MHCLHKEGGVQCSSLVKGGEHDRRKHVQTPHYTQVTYHRHVSRDIPEPFCLEKKRRRGSMGRDARSNNGTGTGVCCKLNFQTQTEPRL